MNGHTPGPWSAFDDEIVADSTDTHICFVESEVATNPAEWQGNMRLIAAAPELLDALRNLLNVIAVDDLIAESVSHMRAARAAIAKVEGRA